MAIKEGQLIEQNGSLIKAEELPQGSHKKIICVCDNCGKEVEKQVKQYYHCLEKHEGHYYCKECFNNDEKILERRLQQRKQTCMEKYGVDNPMKAESVQNNSKSTLLKKYGVEYPGQIEESKEKRKNTCIEKYGVENPIVLSDNIACHTPEARKKAINTMRERYGGVGFELEEIQKKAHEAFVNSGKVPISSQQKLIYEIIIELFPEASECELNFPLSQLSLDTSLVLKNIKIDIETDGKYWHQNRQKDRARDEVVKSFGYKVLRIRIDHNIPTKEELKEALDKLIQTDHTYYELVVSD